MDYRALKTAALTVTKIDDMALWSQAFKDNDTLRGSSGADRLEGFAENDKLTGGGGSDGLSGGIESDTYAFNIARDLTVASGTRGTILDFKHSEQDKVDLKGVDANAKTAGNQAFTFIQDLEFTGRVGELRYEVLKSGTVVLGDRNGDGEPDIAIFMKGLKSLVKSDFVL